MTTPTISPQDQANFWYLRFGNRWVMQDVLDADWKKVLSTLMKNGLVDYHLVTHKEGTVEVYKLREFTTDYADH